MFVKINGGRENVTRCPEKTPRVPPTRYFSPATSTWRVPGLRGFLRIPQTCEEGDMTSGLHAEQPVPPRAQMSPGKKAAPNLGFQKNPFPLGQGLPVTFTLEELQKIPVAWPPSQINYIRTLGEGAA